MASFADLRAFAATSLARAHIETRKTQIATLGWDIVPGTGTARDGHAPTAQFAERRAQAVKFFSRPDANFSSFTSWLRALLEEVWVADALAIYLHAPQKPGCGLLGSSVAALDILDGSRIEPIPSADGKVAGYAHHDREVPRRSLMEMTDRPLSGLPLGLYSPSQILAPVFAVRSWTLFGFSPLEQALTQRGNELDLESAEVLLPAVFGVATPGPAGLSLDASGTWLRRYLDWLARMLNQILEHCGAADLRWQWEGLD